MRNFKRFLTLALAVVMVASMFAFGTSAAQFTDVDENNEYLAKSVNLLNYIGVAKGTSETTFGTDELVTREQMAAFIYRLMKKGNSVEGGTNASRFTDLEDPTFFFMISWADSQGIIKGTSATTFEPKGSITLQDAYTMIVRALGYEKEESLPYPFGYIGVAEDKGVELDEGLDSKVTYTDALTRGDVAILLYNAFFAETGVAETKQVERKIGDDENATWVLETKTEYPTLAEKVYDVLEVEYEVVATPKYAFGGESETTGDLGYDAILFNKVDEYDSDTKDAPQQFYADVKDLAIEGSADDYIMGHFNLFVTLDDDNDIDEILYADSLMTKKTVSDIKLETLTSNTKKSYYGENAKNAKLLSGKAIIDGKDAYFFNAPYSYAKPTYNSTTSSDRAKYLARNEKNLQLIDRVTLSGSDKDDHEYSFKLSDTVFGYPVDGDGEYDEYCSEYALDLLTALKQVYTGGLYEAVVYDVDGDGLYDYINYMPYSFYFVDTDEDYTFSDEGYTTDGQTVYTNEAVIEGEKFADEDFVVGYFDQAANYIKVAKVVEPVKATIDDIKKSTNTITLSTGDKVSVLDAWKLVANYNDEADLAGRGYIVADVDWNDLSGDVKDLQALVSAGAYDADAAKFYVYDGVVLFQEGVDNKITFDSNLIVVTKDEDGNYIETGSFNSATGERSTFVYAWVDGTEKWVAVDTDADVWPNIKDDIDEYVNKVATYTVDSNGLYTIKLLGNAYDDKKKTDDSYIGINKDESELDDEDDDTIQYLYEGTGIEYLTKQVGKRFKSVDGSFNRTFTIDKNSIILIRNEYVDDGDTVVDFVKYTVDTLTESITNKLENVQIVVSNNPDSTRENLVLYFAEANDEELNIEGKTTSKSDRIVKFMEPKMNADKKYYYEYTLFNPYTGTEETVAGNNTSYGKNDEAKASYGQIVELTTAGTVEDKKSDAVKGDILSTASQYWIIDYDADSKMIEVAKLPTNLAEAQAIVNEEAETFRLNVEDVAVTKVGNQGNNGVDMIRWGSISKLAVSDLGSDSKSLRAANNSYAKNDKDTIKTVYGKYIKAYISIDWEDKNDHTATNKDTDCNGDANYVVVIANSSEALYRCENNGKLIED